MCLLVSLKKTYCVDVIHVKVSTSAVYNNIHKRGVSQIYTVRESSQWNKWRPRQQGVDESCKRQKNILGVGVYRKMLPYFFYDVF
jgi:hypothetical protein